jgi:dolichyl-phosphate-mannose--protein O-mannosyl transferase
MNAERLGMCVIFAAALVMVYRLGEPNAYVHDECFEAFTAERYARGDREAWNPHATRATAARFDTADMTAWTEYEWTHPPTAKLVMAASIAAFGFHSTAFRLGSVAFAVLTLIMSWLLARRMRGEKFALLVVTLLACDGMVLVMARVAMNDIYVTGCVVSGAYFLHRHLGSTKRPLRWLVAAGAALGVGVSAKWSAGPLLVGAAIAVAGRVVLAAWRRRISGRALWMNVAAWTLAFVALPACVYVTSYLPYFRAGYGSSDFVALQHAIWNFHHAYTATHTQASPWWQWPWLTRPVWFYWQPSADDAHAIMAMGNPLLWWAFLPSLAWVMVRLAQRRRLDDALILFGFAAAWLPWAFVARIAFLQYLLPAVPFGALAVATVLDDAAQAWPQRGRILRIGYAGLCVAVFLNFVTVWTGAQTTDAQLAGRRWLWFRAWRPPILESTPSSERSRHPQGRHHHRKPGGPALRFTRG